MNISLVDFINNNGDKYYHIANVEAGKKYRISFDADNRFQIQFDQKKAGTEIIKPLIRNLRGVAAHYNYTVSPTVDGELLMADLMDILSGGVEWTMMTNFEVEELA